jgi:hypothetical protein
VSFCKFCFDDLARVPPPAPFSPLVHICMPVCLPCYGSPNMHISSNITSSTCARTHTTHTHTRHDTRAHTHTHTHRTNTRRASTRYAAEAATQVALDAVQCLGGNGYINEYDAGRILRDAKLYEIGAGTSEVRRLIIGEALNKAYR